jgi:sarcosine/dimethylglycine N-methyltransferase
MIMIHTQIHRQYATGNSRPDIERAIRTAGLKLDDLKPADLALLEDFHTMGRLATSTLVDMVDISSASTVLDAGTGIGGTARLVADRFGCRVTAVDLTEEYCETAAWLNRLVGLDDRVSVRQADVTALPFADDGFDVVFSQHVQMNVSDKARLYSEARRVLVGDGQLAMWDITAGDHGHPDYPLPWADHAELSHLVTSARLRAHVEAAGFVIERWEDRTDEAAAAMRMLLALPPNPLGLQAFVADFGPKIEHLTAALADGRLRVVEGVARASGRR